MELFTIPNLDKMTDSEIYHWVETLTTEMVLANLAQLSQAIQNRLGNNILITTATYTSPKLILVATE